jgi:DNA-binding XRE family transcriptional regulator
MAHGAAEELGGLREVLFNNDPERLARVEEHYERLTLAQDLLAMREAAGLTQRQLAELVGTSYSNISRLESATYSGHSLSMLRRIAEALGHRVEVRFVPKDQRQAA